MCCILPGGKGAQQEGRSTLSDTKKDLQRAKLYQEKPTVLLQGKRTIEVKLGKRGKKGDETSSTILGRESFHHLTGKGHKRSNRKLHHSPGEITE